MNGVRIQIKDKKDPVPAVGRGVVAVMPKPWETIGISRSQYYRRRQAGEALPAAFALECADCGAQVERTGSRQTRCGKCQAESVKARNRAFMKGYNARLRGVPERVLRRNASSRKHKQKVRATDPGRSTAEYMKWCRKNPDKVRASKRRCKAKRRARKVLLGLIPTEE